MKHWAGDRKVHMEVIMCISLRAEVFFLAGR